MTDEWLTVLRRVLTEPEVSFEGTYVKVVEARTAELLFPALPSWTKPDPLRLPELRSIPAFADPGRPARLAR